MSTQLLLKVHQRNQLGYPSEYNLQIKKKLEKEKNVQISCNIINEILFYTYPHYFSATFNNLGENL